MPADGHRHVITKVLDGSIGMELELEAGDVLLTVNGNEVEDVFDYRFLINDEFVVLEIEKPDGEIWELEVEKDPQEDLGIEFDSGLMDEYHSCRNKCIFCFIDQMPKGLRQTLYFKDDDSRLSFLQGNYVTLTNLSREEVSRIIRFRLEPINISFHTTNPELRCRMLHNRFAGDSLAIARQFYENGITMNGQIVLCKGINDGEELERTLTDLSVLAPVLQSVSIVPVGLTKYREGLFPLTPFGPEDAAALLSQVHRWQEVMMRKEGIHFVHASDEFYILAGQPLPFNDTYDGYPQLENGVGMIRLQEEEFTSALQEAAGDDRIVSGTIATGMLARPFLEDLVGRLRKKFPRIEIRVIPIRNDFFGERITVSGLVTGQDLIRQLAGRPLGERLFLPANMLRAGEDVFLDDVTLREVEKKLDIRTVIVGEGGRELFAALTGEENGKRSYKAYEQTNSGSCGPAECREVHTI